MSKALTLSFTLTLNEICKKAYASSLSGFIENFDMKWPVPTGVCVSDLIYEPFAQ